MEVARYGWKNGGDLFYLQLDTHDRHHCSWQLGSGFLRVATCRFSAPHEAFLTESHVRHCLFAGSWQEELLDGCRVQSGRGRSCCTPPCLQSCCKDPTVRGVSWRLNLCAWRFKNASCRDPLAQCGSEFHLWEEHGCRVDDH